MLDYSLFLAGPCLHRRALFFDVKKIDPSPGSRSQPNSVQQHCGEIVLRYVPFVSHVGVQSGELRKFADEFFCNKIGFADGGIDVQSLARQTSSQSDKVVWCGDGDSITQKSREMIKNFSFAAECGSWPLMNLPVQKKIVRLDFQTAKNFSDAAALFEHIIEDCVFTAAELSLSAKVLPRVVLVEIIGALGGRRDHELANLSEIRSLFFGQALQKVLHAALARTLGTRRQHELSRLVFRIQRSLRFTCIVQPSIIFTRGPVKISGFPKGFPLSIFVSDHGASETLLWLEGLLYKGKVSLSRASHGLSNEVVEDYIGVSLMPRRARRVKHSNQRFASGETSPFIEIVLGHKESEWLQI